MRLVTEAESVQPHNERGMICDRPRRVAFFRFRVFFLENHLIQGGEKPTVDNRKEWGVVQNSCLSW